MRSIQSCDSSFRVHSGVYQIPHLATSVVLHSDRQSSCGCFGSRPSSCVIIKPVMVAERFGSDTNVDFVQMMNTLQSTTTCLESTDLEIDS